MSEEKGRRRPRRFCLRFRRARESMIGEDLDDDGLASIVDQLEMFSEPLGVPEGCLGEIPDGRKLGSKYCRDYCRERDWYERHRCGNDPLESEITGFAKRQARRPIQDQFEEWLEANPSVWHSWCAATEAALITRKADGPKLSPDLIAGRIRGRVTSRGEPVQINNTYTSRLARKYNEERAVVFRTRTLQRR